MQRIGITQRVEDLPERDERRDCLDQAWAPLMEKIGLIPIPIPNCLERVHEFVSQLGLEGIILSGGNDLSHLKGATNAAPERDACERQLLEMGAQREIPVLGVCRGLQMMAAHYGGALVPVENHVRVHHPIQVRDPTVFSLTDREVNSFHTFGLGVDGVGADLRVVAVASDGSVEAIAHAHHRQAAIMWHPERSPKDPQDAELIKSFFKRVRL
jgi:gamma-glutamyl-gamma-aminobutyrate hydrolase PuuD